MSDLIQSNKYYCKIIANVSFRNIKIIFSEMFNLLSDLKNEGISKSYNICTFFSLRIYQLVVPHRYMIGSYMQRTNVFKVTSWCII